MNVGTRPSDRKRSLVTAEPLVLFVVLGAALFGVWKWLAPPEAETVRIEVSVLRALETQQEELLGRPLSVEEREELREGFIDDEVLLREALRRGFPRSDPRVRQRLIRMMRGSMTETAPEPSAAQLQVYFREKIENYTIGESVTFEQVFYPWGEEVSAEEVERVLREVGSGAEGSRYGFETLVVTRAMGRQTRGDLVRVFGAEFADQLERLPKGEWSGPFESLQGVHLVRVVDRHPPEVAEFEEVEYYLRQDWMTIRTRELQRARIDEIRPRYRVEIVEE